MQGDHCWSSECMFCNAKSIRYHFSSSSLEDLGAGEGLSAWECGGIIGIGFFSIQDGHLSGTRYGSTPLDDIQEGQINSNMNPRCQGKMMLISHCCHTLLVSVQGHLAGICWKDRIRADEFLVWSSRAEQIISRKRVRDVYRAQDIWGTNWYQRGVAFCTKQWSPDGSFNPPSHPT